MSLFDKLNSIPKEKWLYYNRPILNENGQENNSENYEFCQHFKIFFDAFTDPFSFVQNYFGLGGKSGFLPETIFGNKYNPADKAEYYTRAKHVVSTYFLGLYLFYNIPFLQFTKNAFLGKDSFHEFLWAWYLCSLYHDAFYNIEDDITDNAELEQLRDCHFGYCKNSWRLLYDKKTIKRYYEKNINRMKSFDGKVHYDHGILGAEWLYEKYNDELSRLLNDENKERYKAGEPVFNSNGLLFDKKHFNCLCNLAKIIACHNIRICDTTDNDKNKYELAELTNLIPNNIDFHKMPYNKYSKFGVYDKLYLLLSLVDSIEPTKRGIDIGVLNINVNNNSIEITIPNDNITCYNYAKTQFELNTWLNHIKVILANNTNEYIIRYEIN